MMTLPRKRDDFTSESEGYEGCQIPLCGSARQNDGWLIAFDEISSPASFAMKSGLQPCIGCGFQLGCGALADPSSFRSCSIPLESIGASSGSQTTIFVSGRSLASTRATPFSVPGSESRYPIVQPFVLEIPQNLLRRGARVDVGIRFVFELTCVRMHAIVQS